jgi:hypothetical protein
LKGKVKIRLYLDGLDEIPDPARREALVRLARSGAAKYGHLQVVVTARDYIAGPWLVWLPRCHIADFDAAQIKLLGKKWLSPADFNLFLQELDESIISVMRVPLLATLTLLVFRQTRSLATSRTMLYDNFVDLLNNGWDLAKQLRRDVQFGPFVKFQVLQRVALKCHTERTRKVPEAVFLSTANACLKSSTREERLALLGEVLQEGLLVRVGEQLSFAHLSFQEFLAAQCLIGEPKGRRVTHVLREYLRGDNWWLEVLRFYIGLSAKPHDLVSWVTATESLVAKESGGTTALSGQGGRLLREIRTAFPTLAES